MVTNLGFVKFRISREIIGNYLKLSSIFVQIHVFSFRRRYFTVDRVNITIETQLKYYRIATNLGFVKFGKLLELIEIIGCG